MITRSEIIKELKNYFSVEELVCPHAMKFGDKAWQFLDTEILHTILIVRRDILKVGMVCNDYKFKGKNTQRGLRCNVCQLVKDKSAKGISYLSAHVNGAAFDFVSKSMTAEQMRSKIKANANLLPYNVRIEADVTWLHIDCYDDGSGRKIVEFKG